MIMISLKIFQRLSALCSWCSYGIARMVITILCFLLVVPTIAVANSSITYATRIDEAAWTFEGSKFSCQLHHAIDNFGMAVFERPAGLATRFTLMSQSPRMKSGKADLLSQPPMWLLNEPSERLALVNVTESETPVTIKRKVSERMLAELQKGMDIHVVRQPWYGDKQSLKVVIPSVGFGKIYSDYLQCLSGLLPVNFSQVEKKSLYYNNKDSELSASVKRYLEKVAAYIQEDPSVLVVYIDGHTDSSGVKSENLAKSQQRAERIEDYMLAQGVKSSLLVVRWHGERYQVASNQSASGKAKNRRVTIRLSKLPPKMNKNKPVEPVVAGTKMEDKSVVGEKTTESIVK